MFVLSFCFFLFLCLRVCFMLSFVFVFFISPRLPFFSFFFVCLSLRAICKLVFPCRVSDAPAVFLFVDATGQFVYCLFEFTFDVVLSCVYSTRLKCFFLLVTRSVQSSLCLSFLSACVVYVCAI